MEAYLHHNKLNPFSSVSETTSACLNPTMMTSLTLVSPTMEQHLLGMQPSSFSMSTYDTLSLFPDSELVCNQITPGLLSSSMSFPSFCNTNNDDNDDGKNIDGFGNLTSVFNDLGTWMPPQYTIPTFDSLSIPSTATLSDSPQSVSSVDTQAFTVARGLDLQLQLPLPQSASGSTVLAASATTSHSQPQPTTTSFTLLQPKQRPSSILVAPNLPPSRTLVKYHKNLAHNHMHRLGSLLSISTDLEAIGVNINNETAFQVNDKLKTSVFLPNPSLEHAQMVATAVAERQAPKKKQITHLEEASVEFWQNQVIQQYRSGLLILSTDGMIQWASSDCLIGDCKPGLNRLVDLVHSQDRWWLNSVIQNAVTGELGKPYQVLVRSNPATMEATSSMLLEIQLHTNVSDQTSIDPVWIYATIRQHSTATQPINTTTIRNSSSFASSSLVSCRLLVSNSGLILDTFGQQIDSIFPNLDNNVKKGTHLSDYSFLSCLIPLSSSHQSVSIQLLNTCILATIVPLSCSCRFLITLTNPSSCSKRKRFSHPSSSSIQSDFNRKRSSLPSSTSVSSSPFLSNQIEFLTLQNQQLVSRLSSSSRRPRFSLPSSKT